jgi:hypothetical protein
MFPTVGHQALREELASFGTVAKRHTYPFLKF